MVKALLVSWDRNALRMLWKVRKDGRVAYLVGTAHWFPYSFRASLTSLFKKVSKTIFEGPLDELSMQRVSDYGQRGDGQKALEGLVQAEAIERLDFHLRQRMLAQSDGDLSALFQNSTGHYFQSMTAGVRPWMAFFSIWSLYLDWKYSVDMEAYLLARRMRKHIQFLESIDEQLAVLDGIPIERFVGHLNDVGNWSVYQQQYVRAYLDGNLEALLGLSTQFPTRTPVVLSQRDQVLFERIHASIQEQPIAAFIGLSHIPGVSRLFHEHGFEIEQGLG